MKQNYDIIGDIHGHANALVKLLKKLGYELKEQSYQHETNKVIFLGDFIDRGPKQREVIDIVKPMIEQGAALAVMGNHEFNAISFHTNHPQTAKWLREHTPNRIHQHKAFLEEFTEAAEKEEIIDWFKTLPLFLDFNEFRVIHACWNEAAISVANEYLNADHCLNETFLMAANIPDAPQFNAVETLLKGLEEKLPDGLTFNDGCGIQRNKIRIKWWQIKDNTWQTLAIVPDAIRATLPTDKVSLRHLANFRYPKESKPVFIGHYWMTGKPELQQHNVACLDYSVAKHGKLTAYRWNKGDKKLSVNNFVQVG